MDKVRISEVAQDLGFETKEVLAKAKELDLPAKAANSAITIADAEVLANYILTGKAPATKKAPASKAAPQKEAKKATPQSAKEATVHEEKAEQETQEPLQEKAEAKPAPVKPKRRTIEKVARPSTQKEVEKPADAPVQKSVAEETPAKEKEVEEPAQEPVTAIEPEKEPETEPVKKEEPKKETITPVAKSLKKRRGIMIVRKKRPARQETERSTPAKAIMPEIVEGVSRKKKKQKRSATAKQSDSTKLDIFTEGDIANFEIMSEDDMVVLHDFSFDLEDKEEKEKEQQRRKKKFEANNIRTTRNTSFVQQRGISRKSKRRKRRKKEEEGSTTISHIEIPEDIRVYEFAEKLNRPISDVIKVLFNLGMMVTKNDFLEKDAIEILADEFDVDVTTINPLDEFDYERDYEEESDEGGEIKPPVITIMGHVDHGKTSLLDRIRKTKVAAGEHGGITQHIGAYMIEKDGHPITFIDTPGHAAFTEMRARGAEVTDIAVIVVAADDGVKPQTKEAIEHAKAADVPFIVAVTKVDKSDANPDMVKAQMAELGVTPVDWGGEYEFVNVSAHTGEGIDELLEVLLLQAELLELKANPEARAKAYVIESALEKGRGPVATVIVRNGTLHIGDTIVCGTAHGKVRAILNENGKTLKELAPGMPGQIIGLSEVPNAGDTLMVVESDKIAREYAQKRAEYIRQKELSKSTKVTLEELGAKIAEGQIKNLPVILKADVAGSLEAIKGTLEKLKTDEVKVNIISAGVGGITESDITLAEASEHAVILGFNVRPTGGIKEKAKRSGVSVNTYNVIYDLIDDVKALLGGLLSPVVREEQLGQAEVREVFKVPKLGLIAGSLVTDGVINRGAKVRVIRDGVVIYEGEVSSLKRSKDDVREVAKGYECGIGVEGYNDVKPGDYLESFKLVEEKATLE
ncbi:MAG: translation initiation factor IF-2 [Sulfurospirillum sp.]|nr:MAG: translation initiation factor IF-2 [Sulfurospirillum sp.]